MCAIVPGKCVRAAGQEWITRLAAPRRADCARASGKDSAGTFRMLDSTRAYGIEKLMESGEFDDIAVPRHVLLLALHEPVSFRAPTGILDPPAIDRRVLDDVRSAVDWSFGETGSPALGIALT